MDDAQIEYEVALDMARRGREAWLEDPSQKNFDAWRHASETAIKWHRTIRLGGGQQEGSSDDELAEILAG